MNEHPVNSAEYWTERYNSGSSGWDIGHETAVFTALRQSNAIPQPTQEHSPAVFIPGCGFGHDALAYARDGYNVTALDFSPAPLQYLESEAKNQQLNIRISNEDVFTVASVFNNEFDIVLEYTCYCAIDPKRRNEYIAVLAQVTKQHGLVAGIFFPLDDVERADPPFTVQEDEIRAQFEQFGFVLVSSEFPNESHPARAGREKLMIFQKHK